MPHYKEGKQTRPIEFEFMKEVLASNRFKRSSHRSYLAFLYLTGVRRSEALDRVKEDFTKKDTLLTIHIPAKKHGVREILQLSLEMPFMDLIQDQVDKTRPGRKVWNFSGRTALRIIKEAMGSQYYPHFLRLNRSVHFLDDATTTFPEMQSWFGWKSGKTIDSYMGFSQRHLDKQVKRLKDTM